jgi:hypothetical protein
MGLAVDEEDSPSPPPPPPQGFFGAPGWPPLPMRLPHPPTQMLPLPPGLNPHPLAPHPPSAITMASQSIAAPVVSPSTLASTLASNSVSMMASNHATSIRVKRQFDMASLLASEAGKKDHNEDISEIHSSHHNNNNDNSETEANEDSTSWRSVSPPTQPQPQAMLPSSLASLLPPPPPANPLMAHQYLARYYQLVHQHNQHNPSAAAAAAALAAAAAAASVKKNAEVMETSPRRSPHSPIQERSY